MKAIIFAAGEGVRLRPLTLEMPKPLVVVGGKALIEYSFDALPDVITEVVVVVGYKKELIQNYLGTTHRGRPITYVVQETITGSAGALWLCKSLLTEKFLVMYADDICLKVDVTKCVGYERAMLVYQSKSSAPVGAMVIKDGKVHSVIEGGASFTENPLISAGVYVLGPDIFNYPQVPKVVGNAEFGLPQTMIAAYSDIEAVMGSFWLSVTEPKDIERVEKELMKYA
jgi:NDP-sugar pyrophosphorylase family protein